MSERFINFQKKYYPKSVKTFSDKLRWQIREALAFCPTCHKNKLSQRKLARDIGIFDSTIVQFLKGKPIDSGTLDKIVTYFAKDK